MTGYHFYLFWSTYLSSIFLSTFGMIKFYKNSPFRFLPSGGKCDCYFTLKTFTVYLSVMFMFVSKGLLLISVLNDRPMLKLLHSACSFGPNVGQHCPEVTVLYLEVGYRETVFNLTRSTDMIDIFTSDDEE